MSTLTTGRRASYLRLTVAAALRGLIKAFNTNKTSWVGLVAFSLSLCWRSSRRWWRRTTPWRRTFYFA